ncbi:hypothetical protein BMS3Abin03_02783 [bacterium BMS3Abin03]|nr:hypothetical protein BMS3Abin03_02783 [bacterium BMS3Abin03]
MAGNLSKIPNYRSIIFGGSQYADTAFTDFKYSVSKYNQDTSFSSFSIGRLPANSIIDLENYFNKVITFETDTIHSDWMNNNLFYSQYYEGDSVNTYYQQNMNTLINITPAYLNNNYFTENESSENFGNADSVINFLNMEGATSLWLIGGATYTQFGYNPLLTVGDISMFNNDPMFFISIFIAKQFYGYDSSQIGLASSLLFDDNSSIAIFAPVGLYFVSQNNIEFVKLNQELFGTTRKNLGVALNNTRNYFGHPVSHKLIVLNLWGDPSLKLKYYIPTSVEEDNVIPTEFFLYQNYPNPFNPTTKIKYSIPESPLPGGDGRGGLVTLKVYDVLGNEIATLVNEEKPAGSYEVEFNGSNLSSGIYFYQLRAGTFIQTKKMILLR